ncbi:MAG: DUF4430 domain-containing protein [Pirellulaceae bacterium]|nr:DUF4430 domain-containing protein [Pirellulaceae bacterium]
MASFFGCLEQVEPTGQGLHSESQKQSKNGEISPEASFTENHQEGIELTLDFGNGFQKRYQFIKWEPEITVFRALEVASSHKNGFTLKYSGEKERLFVSKIDRMTNGDRNKNWTYLVNDVYAHKSCGVYLLKKGDSVLWRFSSPK